MDMRGVDPGADVLASGIHDAKNRLFEVHSLLVRAEQEHGLGLADARFAICGAANRLSRTLVAYRLLRDQQPVDMTPVPVAELVEDALLTVRTQFDRAGVALRIDTGFEGEWPLDRTLVTDILVNALQNACRHANSAVRLEIRTSDRTLQLCINDDGAGFPVAFAERLPEGRSGLGLFIACRLAQLHVRKGARGSLSLTNGGALGGALFELRLP